MQLPFPITKNVKPAPGDNHLSCANGTLCVDFDVVADTTYTFQFCAGDTVPKYFTVSSDTTWIRGVPNEPAVVPAATAQLTVVGPPSTQAQAPYNIDPNYVVELPAGPAHVKVWSAGLSAEKAEPEGLSEKAAGTDFEVRLFFGIQALEIKSEGATKETDERAQARLSATS